MRDDRRESIWWVVRRIQLTEGIHQLVDGAVEVLVVAAKRVDLVDRVEDCCVMLATELPADLRERGGGELLHQIHRDLARKRDGLPVRANFQVLLAQTKLLADLLLNQVDGDALLL